MFQHEHEMYLSIAFDKEKLTDVFNRRQLWPHYDRSSQKQWIRVVMRDVRNKNTN